jgi:hypothetical protein
LAAAWPADSALVQRHNSNKTLVAGHETHLVGVFVVLLLLLLLAC